MYVFELRMSGGPTCTWLDIHRILSVWPPGDPYLNLQAETHPAKFLQLSSNHPDYTITVQYRFSRDETRNIV